MPLHNVSVDVGIAGESATYVYDFRDCTHRLIKNGRITAEITDRQLIEAVDVIAEMFKALGTVVSKAAEGFTQFAEAYGIDTTPHAAKSFVSRAAKQAIEERTAIEEQTEIARLNNPGIGMRALQDELAQKDYIRYGS